MRNPLLEVDGQLLLTSKVTAALIGVAEQTLRQARCNTRRSARHDLYFPAPVVVLPRTGERGRVWYPLSAVQQWADQMGRTLRWADLPVSHRLPVARAAGLPLPAALALAGG